MEFEFSVDDESPPSGFDLGHMTVRGNRGTATSRDHQPDQAMMIHLSLSELLDGFRAMSEQRRPTHAFGAVDSSYALHFRRLKDGRLATRSGGSSGPVIDESGPNQAAQALGAAAATFADRTLPLLSPDEAAAQDLRSSLADFAIFLDRAGS